MDLKVYDFNTGSISFSKHPSSVKGAEEIAQYIAKLLLQLPGSNPNSPDGGVGIFKGANDFFVMADAAIEDLMKYIYEQQTLYPDISDDMKLGNIDIADITYENGIKKINLDILTETQEENILELGA